MKSSAYVDQYVKSRSCDMLMKREVDAMCPTSCYIFCLSYLVMILLLTQNCQVCEQASYLFRYLVQW